jgi:hypothetical protein
MLVKFSNETQQQSTYLSGKTLSPPSEQWLAQLVPSAAQEDE